ncbi:MAG: monofunctional biosynthetic peptidoglycan transglycosylase [Hyphomicrobium sp.]|uniref:monofunctional biosynthetic peptidoglycan transglycosylase n=1 Tax=Hyphomicrobium sp. TaxID=82 RepID=UPI0039E6FA44
MDRRDDTSGLSAAPSATLPDEMQAFKIAGAEGLGGLPPRPLPARAFHQPHGFLPDSTPLSDPAPEVQGEGEPLSPDAAFSALEAEASARSLSAVESAAATALREIQPHKPIEISELALPLPRPFEKPDLGHTIPGRMFEPRFETPAAQPAFDSLQIDPEMRPDAPPLAAPPKPVRDYRAILKRCLKVLAWVAIGWLALVLSLIVLYRFVNPPASMLMLQNWLSGQKVAHTWVPFGEISPNVVRAVVLSEDGRFCEHFGVDLEAIEEAIENTDGRSRGGSTISMQVVKNLFLWPSKSYIRKAIELPLTYLMELVWSKRRIMEVYLNIAEWGPGIFGIGAAAQYHFQKTARGLSVRDAARLAVSLPNPLARNAGRPGPGLQRLANAIQVRMRLAPSSQFACVLPKRLF